MQSITPLLIGFNGLQLTSDLARHLHSVNPAGVVLFKRNFQNAAQARRLVADLHGLGDNFIVAIDHEGGMVSRLSPDLPSIPAAMALGFKKDWSKITEALNIQAQTLAWLGINLNFAPVADTSVSTENRALGTRAFSANPEEVGKFVVEVIKAHQAYGIGTTVKHFPGFGGCRFDPHFDSGRYRRRLHSWQKEVTPFRQAIESGVSAVMSTHALYPKLDSAEIATFSRKILRQLLRKDFGFQGLVITDCIEMAGAGANQAPESLAEACLQAGNDLIISSFSLKKDVEFQIRLSQHCQHLIQADSGLGAEWLKTLERLKAFARLYPARKVKDKLPSPDLAIALARHFIEVRPQQPLPPKPHFILLEVVAEKYAGINQDEPFYSAGQRIRETLPILWSKALRVNDKEATSTCLRLAKMQNCGVILLTADAWREADYAVWIALFADQSALVHVALLSPRDLRPKIGQMQYVLRGYNSTVNEALCRLLSKVNPVPAT